MSTCVAAVAVRVRDGFRHRAGGGPLHRDRFCVFRFPLDEAFSGHYGDLMPLRETIFLLPCASLEELPTWHQGDQAAELLTAWTLGWHPWLLAQSGRLPVWKPPHTPPEELGECIVLLPELAREQAPSGWLERLEADGLDTLVVTSLADRRAALGRLLTGLPKLEVGPPPSSGDAGSLLHGLAPDFFALGFAALVVELLGHTMHYSSNIDRDALQRAACEAARAAADGDQDLAQEKLQRSFDLLGEARDYYYPVDSYFLHLALLAPTVWGDPLRDMLEDTELPLSVLLSASQAGEMAEAAPKSLTRLRAAVEEGRASVVGGDWGGDAFGHRSLEAILEELTDARRTYEELLGRPPTIFGRFSGGFSPMLPCLLEGLDFDAALLVSFDGARVPTADQCRFRWEGADGSAIDTLSLVPQDAGDAGSLLQLAERLAHSMQQDHVATVLFASWPGYESQFYDDLRRASSRCNTLGRFITIGRYLEETYGGDLPASFGADSFSATSELDLRPTRGPHGGEARHEQKVVERARLLYGVTEIVAPSPFEGPQSSAHAEEQQPSRLVEPMLARLAESLAGGVESPAGRKDATEPAGVLAVNLGSQERTLCFALGRGQDAAGREPAPPDRFVANIPPLGFAWQAAGSAASPVPLAEGTTLRNEYFEVHINQQTGGIASIHDYRRRSNRLSQQLAYRFSGAASSAEESQYTRMVADGVRITAATDACGEITSQGRLLDHREQVVANFRQSTRVQRGSRLIELTIEILGEGDRGAVGSDGYFAARWAWRNEPAEVRRSLHGASFPTSKRRVPPTEFLEILEDDGRLVVYSAVPAGHLRSRGNRLDTFLPREAIDAGRARLALGIDVEGGAGAWSDEWQMPPLVCATSAAPSVQRGERAWWFHCSSRRVRWTAVAPLRDGRSGFTARLHEPAGRYVQATVEAYRPIRSARRTNLHGTPQIELPVRDGRIELQMAGYQWIQLEAEWE